VRPNGENGAVVGAVLIVILLLVVLPAAFWVTWGLMAFLLGWLLKDNGERTHPGSELIETNI
jgi:hypothetical protein